MGSTLSASVDQVERWEEERPLSHKTGSPLLPENVPAELWHHVFSFLPLPSVGNLLLVNKQLNCLAEAEVQRLLSKGFSEEEYALFKRACTEANVRGGKVTQQQFERLAERFFEATASDRRPERFAFSPRTVTALLMCTAVSLYEATRALALYLHGSKEELIECLLVRLDTFQSIDKNGNGFIEQDELQQACVPMLVALKDMYFNSIQKVDDGVGLKVARFGLKAVVNGLASVWKREVASSIMKDVFKSFALADTERLSKEEFTKAVEKRGSFIAVLVYPSQVAAFWKDPTLEASIEAEEKEQEAQQDRQQQQQQE
ncbi:hypothetical protein QOT17_020761 [Balamuthia mandrillaris]